MEGLLGAEPSQQNGPPGGPPPGPPPVAGGNGTSSASGPPSGPPPGPPSGPPPGPPSGPPSGPPLGPPAGPPMGPPMGMGGPGMPPMMAGGPPMAPPGSMPPMMAGGPPMPPPGGMMPGMPGVPPMGGAVAMDTTPAPLQPKNPPNHTVYVHNLNERVKEEELKKTLTTIFKQFGEIVQITAMSSLRRRGQAFIVFDKLESAEDAVDSMQGFPFHGKPLKLDFAKTDSDVIAKRSGTFVPREKKPLPEKPKPVPKRPAPMAVPQAAMAAPPPMAMAMPAMPQPVMEVPNNILFLTELPEETTQTMLQMLFNQFRGFVEVRLVPGRHDIAFVEYSTEMEAAEAKNNLNGFTINGAHRLNVAYAKK